ncbi:MAG: transcription-repair coupling factor, partial [Bacteroidia bacterium]|nr:transcription-repair coupling factor [Bacteroidia bacterium]
AEVLSKLNQKSGNILIVTYPEAICEKVTTKETLEKNTMEARVGEQLSIEFISEFLNECDFERTDFVVEAGQFAIRGGIVDIYSFANELPYRLEFEDETIQSIRTFDPESQLSEAAMNHITIIPNIQSKLLSESRDSFLNYIGNKFRIWAKDLNYSLEFIGTSVEKMISDKVEQEIDADLGGFDDDKSIKSFLRDFKLIETGGNFFDPDVEIKFDMDVQPPINKNFPMLLKVFGKFQRRKYRNLIFSDNSRQIERIYSIIEDITPEEHHLKIEFTPIPIALHEGFVDNDLKLACFTDHQIFNRYHRFRLRRNYSRSDAITLKELYSLKPGDFVSHIDHGIGRFGGLHKIEVKGRKQEAIRLIYKDNDVLYISIHSLHRIAKYSGKEGTKPTLNKLGSQTWARLKQKTKKRVKDIARDLIALYAKRKAAKGFAFLPDTYLQTELEASFIYEDTPDQLKASNATKEDMEKSYPMDRLICGDVGFGKTEVAIRAAFKAVTDNKQVAILVPTTILALQHYNTFKDRLREFPCNIDYLNRFKSGAAAKATIKKLAEGKVDIIIGTHRLISKDIVFKDLGLLVIDEEQKFGVSAKEKLKKFRINVDTLTLTATPIPRTLQFSLMGARDLSIINTPPPNRFPVTTEIHVFNEDVIRDSIMYELSRGGQVFFVHNRVMNIVEVADMVTRLCPDAKVGIGHGQMDGHQLEQVLMSFIGGEIDVLVATTIIESGLDISNANTIIINQAQNFGLSDLHQMRGRVGRSNTKAFCYLITPPLTAVTPEARRRLKAIEQFSDIGSGFNIAMRDLDIRGAGNLLGGEQSGFISEIGFEMYHKILDEAIQELKEKEFKDVFKDSSEKLSYVQDCQIDTDLEILIPSEYVSSITERLNLYNDLDKIENENELQKAELMLKDRFGPVPVEVLELLQTIKLRWLAKDLGFEKIVLKNNKLRAYFVSNKDSEYFNSPVFGRMLQYVQANPKSCSMKEAKGRLSLLIDQVKSVNQAFKLLKHIDQNAVVN